MTSVTQSNLIVQVTNTSACSTVNYALAGWKYDIQLQNCPFNVSFNGSSYTPVEMHCHTPSEHSIDNKYFDGECHLVLNGTSGNRFGKIFVITVFLDASQNTYNAFIGQIWNSSNYPSSQTNANLALMGLLPLQKGQNMVVVYHGRGTTPPCGEDYIFAIFPQALSISRSQLDGYQGPLGLGGMPQPSDGATARPVQPYGSRPPPLMAVFK